ncbi:hypothetical protein [Microbacterium sp. R86528]|uniref:hypothetical protein n=1 Tax=Microbacterium sp. R86528 TaxID=3093864 RepID=UPI0037C57518
MSAADVERIWQGAIHEMLTHSRSFGLVRTSPIEQNNERQHGVLIAAGVAREHIIAERGVSGRAARRAGRDGLLDLARPEDATKSMSSVAWEGGPVKCSSTSRTGPAAWPPCSASPPSVLTLDESRSVTYWSR